MMHVLTRSEVIGHSRLVSAMRMARVRPLDGCLPLLDFSNLAVDKYPCAIVYDVCQMVVRVCIVFLK